MKKIFLILTVFCLGVALFAEPNVSVKNANVTEVAVETASVSEPAEADAPETAGKGITIRVGGIFNFVSGSNTENPETTTFRQSNSYKNSGIGLDIGIDKQLSSVFSSYFDLNVTFPKEMPFGSVYLTKSNNLSIFAFSANLGLAYKFGFDIPVDIKAGLGLFIQNSGWKDSANQRTVLLTDSGVAFSADVSYKLNNSFSAGLSITGRLNILNSCVDITGTTSNQLIQNSLINLQVGFGGISVIPSIRYTF